MALRLFLVSLVAGLGLTLPSGGRSAQSWIHARLAEWDARATDDGQFVIIDEPAVRAVAPVAPAAAAEAAVSATVEPAPASTRPVILALATDADTDTDINTETVWTRDARPVVIDGLDVPPTPTAPSDLEIATVGLPADALDAAFNAAQDDLIRDFATLPAAPTGETVTVAATPVVETGAALDGAFEAALKDVIASFAADRPAGEPERVAHTQTEPAPTPTFEPLVVDEDLYPGVAYALNREAEGLNLTPPAPPEDIAAFEPLVVGDELYPGVAYALNREAEGLNLPMTEPVASESHAIRRPVGQTGGLIHAVRLTREAVYAWANLLHGPAVVTLAP
jgi:hypothetical protein